MKAKEAAGVFIRKANVVCYTSVSSLSKHVHFPYFPLQLGEFFGLNLSFLSDDW